MKVRALLSAAALIATTAFGQTFSLPPNTSATSTTPAFSNGTEAGSTSVSHQNIHNYLYSGNTTQVMVHYLGWFDGGQDGAVNVNYSNSDPNYINKFFWDIGQRGVDGVIVDWQGETDVTNTSWLVAQPLIKNWNQVYSGKPLTYMIMLDANLLNNYSGTNQQKVMAAYAYITSHFTSDTNYVKVNGHPVVGDFGLTGVTGIDWVAIHTAYPTIWPVHLDNADPSGTDGFNEPDSAGSFVWPNPTLQDVVPADLSTLDDFYTRSNLHPAQITIGAIYKGFASVGTDGTVFAPWDPKEYVDQQCGQTFLNTFVKVNQYFNSAKQLNFLQIATWDDYYEGTPVETGVDNCLQIGATVNGRTITVTQTGAGNLNTVQNVVLWSYVNNAWSPTYYLSNTTSITVPSAGVYYIENLGNPMFKNTLSQRLVIN